MPWTALPYTSREKKAELSTKCGVRGIPMLIIFDKDASIITINGRGCVGSDPDGKNFPWIPRKFSEILGENFIGKTGDLDATAIQGKYLGLYFSAHW